MKGDVDFQIVLGRSTEIHVMDPKAAHDSAEDFADLYRRTLGMVRALLGRRGIVRHEEKCELSQDVYFVVHQELPHRNRDVPVEAWVARIADFTARNYRDLKRARMEQPKDHEGSLDPRSLAQDPETTAVRRGWYRHITRDLDGDQLFAFELVELYDCTTAEAALTMNRPEGTVKTWLRNVRAELATRAARDARDDGRPLALLPFGVGAWRGLFNEEVPEGIEDEIWSGVCRAIARRRAALAISAGSATGVVSKVVAGALAIGGLALGAGLTLLVLRLVGWAPLPVLAPVSELAPIASETATAAPKEPAPGATGSASVAMPASTGADNAPTLDREEVRLIERAQAAYARKDMNAALHAVDEHARRFPQGTFQQDRDRLRKLIQERSGAALSPTTTPDAGRKRIFGHEDED